MSSGLGSVAIWRVVVLAASAFTATATIKKSRGGCVRAVFDIICGDWIRRRSYVAAAHSTTAFVAKSQ